jgi:pyroglutamyl-peptidase
MRDTPIKVLVSGFEPFGGSNLNPSQLLVNELSLKEIPGVEIVSIVLPVEFDAATNRLLEKVRESKPDIVISFGQAEGRSAITPEKIAINLDDARIKR